MLGEREAGGEVKCDVQWPFVRAGIIRGPGFGAGLSSGSGANQMLDSGGQIGMWGNSRPCS